MLPLHEHTQWRKEFAMPLIRNSAGFAVYVIIPAPSNPKQFLISAKSETVVEKSTSKNTLLESRYLTPARYSFEWMETDDGRMPFTFVLIDMEKFPFAGIYNDSGFVILTCVPNEVVERFITVCLV